MSHILVKNSQLLDLGLSCHVSCNDIYLRKTRNRPEKLIKCLALVSDNLIEQFAHYQIVIHFSMTSSF